MSVLPSRSGITNAFSRSASSFRRAQRNRRRSTVEVLEGRVVLSYAFAFNGTNAATVTQTANSGNAGDALILVQVPAVGLEYSVNGSAFSSVWTGGTPPNTSAVTVTIDQANSAIDNTITIGTPGGTQPVSPISTINAKFVIDGTPATTSVTLDDSTGGSAGTYSYDGTTATGPNGFTATVNAVENNGLTIKGSSFADTYNALAAFGGEPVSFVGGAGANTVNVGSNPGTPASSTLNNIDSAVSFSDTQTGGTATVNVNDSGSTNSASGTLAFTSPNEEKVTGLGFGAGGSFSFNTGTPGTTALNLNQGTNGAAGVTTNVTSTPSTLSTTITGGANANTFNVGGATPGNLGNVQGPVTIAGGGATSAIDLNDQSNVLISNYTVTSTTVTHNELFGGLTYSGVGFLTLNAGTDGNIIGVNSTANGITTNVNSNGDLSDITVNGTGTGGTLNVSTATTGQSTVNVVAASEPVNVTTNGTPTADTVNIGAAGGTGSLPGITGLVTVTGNQPYALTINDQGDASPQTYNVTITNPTTNTGTLALGNGPAILSFHPNSVTGLTFNGSNQGNIINFLELTPRNVTTSIFAGAGSDVTTLKGSGPGSTVNIDSQGSTNFVVLGGNSLTPFPQGAQWLLGTSVSVSDTGGTTGLTIDDSQDTTARTVAMSVASGSGSVSLIAPASITYTESGTSGLTVNGGSGGNTFTIDGTLVNAGVDPTVTTVNKGAGLNHTTNSVDVMATSLGSVLELTGSGAKDSVIINPSGDAILGPVNIDEAPGSTALTIDLSDDGLPHTFDLSSDGTTSTLHDELGNAADFTYITTSLASFTLNTDGSESQTFNLNFGDGGNPIPTASSPGLVFNAINPAPGVSNTLNISGELSSGAFTSETHNANDQTVFPQDGQYGSIAFVDANSVGTSLDYTGLQPLNDTSPAVLYTFNDFGYPDQSFQAQDGPTAGTIQFVNAPTPPTPLNFEATTISNKTDVVFNTPPQTVGVAGPAVSGQVNIPTASTGLATLTFNTPNDGNNNVSFLALPAGVTTTYNGDGAQETTSVAGAGVATGTTLTLNGGPAINTLIYDAGDLVPTVAPIDNGLSITVPGAGTVDVLNYQQVNIINVAPVTITPPTTPNPISSVEGFNYVNIPVGTFTAPVPPIFTLNSGAPQVPTLPASDFTASIDWGDPSPDPAAGAIAEDASNAGDYFLTGSHTFAAAGTYTVNSTLNFAGGSISYNYPVTFTTTPAATSSIAVTVSFNALPSGASPITFADTATVTQGPLAVTVFPTVGTEGADIGSAEIATFVDAGGANPFSDYSAAVSIVAPDGTTTTPVGPFTIAQIGNSAQYTVTGDLGIPPDEGVYTVLVAITDNSGAPATTVTGAGTATIADAPLTLGLSPLLTPDTGVALPTTTVVGRFVDANPAAPLTDFTATIDWGDGSPISQGTIVQTGGLGSPFEVEGGHTYAKFGAYTITTVVNDVGGSTVTVLGSATVADLAVTGSTNNFTATEGINTGTFALATFTDPNTLATVADEHATLAIGGWGDGSPAAAGVALTVQQIGADAAGDPVFEVLGSHTYAEETLHGLANTLSVIITTSGGAVTTLTSPPGGGVTVLDAPLTSSNGTAITGVEGSALPANTVLGTFTDANPGATNADFLPAPGGNGGSVVVNWGDGSAPETLTAASITASGSPQGVIFNLTDGHTYAEEGTYGYTITVNDDGGSTTVISGTAVIADAPLTAGPSVTLHPNTGVALPTTTVVGTFTDTNTDAPASDFTAVIDWGDGSPTILGTVISTGGGGFSVEGGHIYAKPGDYSTHVNVLDVGGSAVTLVGSALVTDLAVTGSTNSFTATEGINTGTFVLATFTDPNTLATVSDVTAALAVGGWGDGSPTTAGITLTVQQIGATAAGSIFEVLGSHTYAEETPPGLPNTLSVIITTSGGVVTTLTSPPGGGVTVRDAALTSSNGTTITGVEGTAISATTVLGTFTDANPGATNADFLPAPGGNGGSVVVNWGDGSAPETLAAANITASGSPLGVIFSLTDGHLYHEEGTYSFTITVKDDGGSTTVISGAAVIADADLTAGTPVALTPKTGVLLTNVTVATFTDANTVAPVSDFTATIDWGDGSATTIGTIVQPGGVGTPFDVEGTHAYAKPGTYDTKVVVTDVGGSVVFLPGTATVSDPSLTGSAPNFSAVEGISTGTILLATIDNPNTLAGVSQLTATVNWGDSTGTFTVPVSLVGGTASDSIFQINGSHTYAEEGTFTVMIMVTTTDGATTVPPPASSTSPLTSTATVVDAPLVAVGSDSISGEEGISTGTKLVATWTDTNPGATVADYTTGGGSVVVNWGDGTTPVTLPATAITASGSPNGVVFSASVAHTYAEAGSYQITTTIDDDGGSTAVAHGTAVIADAPLSAPTQTPASTDLNGSTITETVPFTTVVATFNDANPLAPTSDYNYVTIDWGDGTPMSNGIVIQPGGVGTTFEVLGSHTYEDSLVNGGVGTFPTITNIHDEDGSTLVVNNTVKVADIPIILTGQLNPASDTGESNTDAITDISEPNFFGTSEPFSDITILVAPVGTSNFKVVGQGQTDSSGEWSVTTNLIPDGQYTVEAHAVEQTPGVTTATTQILPNATQGVLTIDTVGPKVTALRFDRVDGQIDITFQDNLSGLDQTEVVNAADYKLTKLHTIRGSYLVNMIGTTTDGPTGPESGVLSINNGRQLRGGIYTFTVFSASFGTGIRDVAGNALDGEFYGFFPSGNNIPGGNFEAGLDAVHHTIFAPKTLIGRADLSPPGTPATGSTIPTANPSLPSGNPNFHGNPSLLRGAKVHHHVRVAHAVKKSSVHAHDLALEQLVQGN